MATHAHKVGGILYVRGLLVPVVSYAAFDVDFPPIGVALENICRVMFLATKSPISLFDGQMSFRKTFLPVWSMPSGSLAISTFIEPAMAYDTTSGGEAR